MRTPSTPTIVLLAALALAAGAALLAGCESRPAEPVYDNPWDPDGPLEGDALQVRASASDTTIIVFWNQPQGQGITLYVVSHALDAGGEWVDVGEVPHVAGSPSGFFQYFHPEPTRIHYFRVQAFTDDDFSIVGYGRPAAVMSTPAVIPVPEGKTRASRYVDLEITVTEGDFLRLANDTLFTAADTVAVASLGEPQLVTWDQGPLPASTTYSVFVQAFGADGRRTPRAKLDFTANFAPALSLVGNPATIASRAVNLVVPTAGVVAMRFALSSEGLADAPWQAPADTVRGFMIAESANVQRIWAEFEGDQGYNTTTSVLVTPDNLALARFALDVPANRVIAGPAVAAVNTAVATRMRFAEHPDLTAVPWEPYRNRADLILSAGEGRKVVYAQFANDWADSPILTQYVDVVRQRVAVAILAPGNGTTVPGGTTLEVRGTALAGSTSDRIDSVRVDLGDGQGWRAPTGSASWALLWNVPTVAEATPRTLRARAWATDTLTTVVDSVTAVVAVTVGAPDVP
ncbi:MAG: Ig-like domain-containing protein [Candidatus Krumholzibacteriia bacterium]